MEEGGHRGKVPGAPENENMALVKGREVKAGKSRLGGVAKPRSRHLALLASLGKLPESERGGEQVFMELRFLQGT